MQIKDVVKAIKSIGDVKTPVRIGEIDPDESKNFVFRFNEKDRFVNWVKETFKNNINLFKIKKDWYLKRFFKKSCCEDNTNIVDVDNVRICYECGYIN